MMTKERRTMYQGIHSSLGPKAIGPYSPAVKLGDFVYLSGQLPLDPQTGTLVNGDMVEQTYQVLRNMEAVLAQMGLELRHVVKTTVYMTDLTYFSAFNEIYAALFQDPYPARTTVQVAALPMGAMIEIDALVIDTLAYEAHLHRHSHGECGCGHDYGGCGESGHDHEHEKCACGKSMDECSCDGSCGSDCNCK